LKTRRDPGEKKLLIYPYFKSFAPCFLGSLPARTSANKGNATSSWHKGVGHRTSGQDRQKGTEELHPEEVASRENYAARSDVIDNDVRRCMCSLLCCRWMLSHLLLLIYYYLWPFLLLLTLNPKTDVVKKFNLRALP
jgi:hypothetical protein